MLDITVITVVIQGQIRTRFRPFLLHGRGMFMAGFAGEDTFHAVFSLVVNRLEMLGIMVGMDQKDSFAE